MTETAFREGFYKLIRLDITTASQILDLSPYVARCDLYESILSPSVVGEFVISDSVGLFSSFNFAEETISIEFTTYEEAAPVSYKLKVVSVDTVTPTPNDKAVTLVLTGVSEELLKSRTIRNIPLVMKNLESDRAVVALLNLVETKKQIAFEKTKGLHTFALTNITPFEAIDQVRRQALSPTHNSSSFVFFENKYGYTFKTIEQLVEEGLRNTGDKFFFMSPTADVDSTATRWRNILGFKNVQMGNQNVALAVGGYNNIVNDLNLETGELTQYQLAAKDTPFVTLNKDSQTSSLSQLNSRNKDEGRITFRLYNPDQENNQLSEKYNVLPYYISQLLTVINHVTIYGDTTITVGDVITCKLPELTGLTIGEARPRNDDNPLLSGNYLITKLRHCLSFGAIPKYYQALEVVRDGVGGSLPNVRYA